MSSHRILSIYVFCQISKFHQQCKISRNLSVGGNCQISKKFLTGEMIYYNTVMIEWNLSTSSSSKVEPKLTYGIIFLFFILLHKKKLFLLVAHITMIIWIYLQSSAEQCVVVCYCSEHCWPYVRIFTSSPVTSCLHNNFTTITNLKKRKICNILQLPNRNCELTQNPDKLRYLGYIRNDKIDLISQPLYKRSWIGKKWVFEVTVGGTEL